AAIEHDEHFAGYGRSAPVAVNERMVARQAKRQARGEIGKVRRRVAVRVQLLRTGEGGVQQAFVTHTAAAAVLAQLAVVDGNCKRLPDARDHGRHYCASLLSNARRSRMTCSATSICSASVGSNTVSLMPSGVSSANSSSPFCRRRRASRSLGRMTPEELPMVVILSFMAGTPGRL